jgi:hypothetical protein
MGEIKQAILDEIREYILWTATLKGHGWARRLPDYWEAGVPYRPADILGRSLLTAERKAWSRAAEALAGEGSVIRVSSGVGAKTTHLQPTAALAAAWLAEADGETGKRLLEGLRRSHWGIELAAELTGA